jgi:cytochrome P450 family 142 subfamily A polypeptide 1
MANGPEPWYEWMRANAPVYWDEAGNVWGIAKYDDLELGDRRRSLDTS